MPNLAERDETSSTRASNATISSGAAKYNNSIFVDLQVSGEMIKFLVDTGSSISMVHYSCWQNSPSLQKLPLQQTSLQAVTANGLPLQVTGAIEADVGLGLQSMAHKFYVASDLKSDGILGLDLLELLGATVDIKEGYLRLGPAKLSIQHCQRGAEVARIVIKENTTIPANHEVVFPAEIESKGHPTSIEGVVEPEVLYRKQAYWLGVLANSTNQHTPVRLLTIFQTQMLSFTKACMLAHFTHFRMIFKISSMPTVSPLCFQKTRTGKPTCLIPMT